MRENVLQRLQIAIQDVIRPDVRELKVRLAGLENRLRPSSTHFENSTTRCEVRLR
jgi:hypothetical protein